MAGINSILFLTDFTPCSEQALAYTMQLAGELGARLHVAHFLEPVAEVAIEGYGPMPVVPPTWEEDTMATLNEKVAIVGKSLPTTTKALPAPVECHAVWGVSSPGVFAFATSLGADMVAMGTRHTEHRPWWDRSMASALAHHPEIPLLVVPEGTGFQRWDRLTFATDLRREDLLMLVELAELLSPMKPDIRCIHVSADDTDNTLPFDHLAEICEKQLPQLRVTFHQLFEDDTTEAIEAFSLIYHVDLQVLTRPYRGFFQELVHRSQVRKTLQFTHLPLLILPG